MHWLDVVLLALLALGAALGVWSGLVMQLARLVSLAVAVYLTFLLNEPATRLLHTHIAPDANVGLLQGVAYVAVFLVVYILLFALSRLLYRLVHATKLVLLDRLAGGLLGALKMALFLGPLCAGLTYLALPTTDEWLRDSKVAPVLARGTREAFALVPEAYRTQARESVDAVRTRVQHEVLPHAVDLDQIEAALKK